MKTFRLIGNTMKFTVTSTDTILMGTVEIVRGVSVCGHYRTSARVEDVINLDSAA